MAFLGASAIVNTQGTSHYVEVRARANSKTTSAQDLTKKRTKLKISTNCTEHGYLVQRLEIDGTAPHDSSTTNFK